MPPIVFAIAPFSLDPSLLLQLVQRRIDALARRMADRLKASDVTILNDVVLNQVLARFGDDETTRKVIDKVQAEGTCWAGGTFWQGTHAMRIAVSNWSTTEADIDRSADAIVSWYRGDRPI